MLTLNRKKLERIIITVPPCKEPQTIEVCVAKIRGSQVALGFEADDEIIVDRGEVFERKQLEKSA